MTDEPHKLRGLADRIGFAHRASQMDAVMRRIEQGRGGELRDALLREHDIPQIASWRVAIAPHGSPGVQPCRVVYR